MENTDSAALKIRYYIYGLLKEHGESSIRIPSSYELAKRFATTRRVAQYELERQIEEGVLIGKHRVGTFTNPLSDYSRHVALDGPMPLIGVIYGNGDFFSYSPKATLTIAGIYRALAYKNCKMHDLRLSPTALDRTLADIKTRNLDGVIWAVHGGTVPNRELLRKLELPLVVLSDERDPGISGVQYCWSSVSRELAECMTKENRKKILFVGLKISEKPGLIRQELMNHEIHTESIRLIRGESINDLNIKAEAGLDPDNPPDAVFCSDGIGIMVQGILKKLKIDFVNRTRIIQLQETLDPNFTGIILSQPYEEAAEAGVRLILEQIEQKKPLVRHIPVEMRLRKQNIE